HSKPQSQPSDEFPKKRLKPAVDRSHKARKINTTIDVIAVDGVFVDNVIWRSESCAGTGCRRTAANSDRPRPASL
ncbi:MAG: hypothetical protein ACKPJD_20655, partial [Planctomycetaceae bacterium]